MTAKKAVAVEAKIIRAIDPDVILQWLYEGVTYSYRQPAGVFSGTTPKEHGDLMIDYCMIAAKGLSGVDAIRKRGYAWSKIIPQAHANRLYLELLAASVLTEAEAGG